MSDPDIDPFRTTDKTNRHTANGEEVLNPTPLRPPVGHNPQPNMWDQMQKAIRLAKLDALNMEAETEEEADDFDIDDDPPIPSRWENDLVPSIKDLKAAEKALEEEVRMYADAAAAEQRARELHKPPKEEGTP